MKALRYSAFFLLTILALAATSYFWTSKSPSIPKDIQKNMLTSLIEKEHLISLSSVKGKLYSPSVIAKDEGYVFAAVVQNKHRYKTRTWKSKDRPLTYTIALTHLNDNFEPSGNSQIVQPKLRSGVPLFQLTNVQLISHQGQIWAFYTNEPSPEKNHLYAAPVFEKEGSFSLGSSVLIQCPSAKWSALVYDEKIYIFADDEKQSSMEVDLLTGKATAVSQIEVNRSWSFGKLMNPSVLVNTEYGIACFFDSIYKKTSRCIPISYIGACSILYKDHKWAMESILKNPIGSKKLYSSFNNKKKQVSVTSATEKSGKIILSTLTGGNKVRILEIKAKEMFNLLDKEPVTSDNSTEENK
ncbi:MAG: hypothetical protein FJZ56_01985 [Chlamydiae bacterium]|nr:hypothetical protein [Chlamydiota bacterium]